VAARRAKKTSAKKASAQKTARRKAGARKSLAPRREARGPAGDELPLALDAPEVATLVAEVRAAGGAALGAYREPLAGHPLLLAALPREAIEPTPFQRDLSPTHTRRLAEKIEASGSFLDPLIAVRGASGGFWTPNGRHRLAAAKVLGMRQVIVLLSPDADLAFKILALNTEKAHNLKDRSLEVIRMAREIARRNPRALETGYPAEFEAPELLTLGIVYEREPRFAGGAYSSFLKKVDRFAARPLAKALVERAGFASRLLEIDAQVKRIVKGLEGRGFRSPYLRNYVVARINPVRFHKAKKTDAAPPMPIGAALTRMAAAARRFDLASVRSSELALVAAVAGD
jgi:ParB family chromosome partitioning protein